jgi:hypothetical protein
VFERLPLVVDLKLVLVLDPVLEPVLVLEPDSVLVLNLDPILDLDPGLVPNLKPAVSRGDLSGEGSLAVKDPVQSGGLSVEQRKDFNHVFLEMFPDSASCSQGPNPNIPMEDGLTIPQWWLLDWLRDQVKNDEAQLAFLMDVEEEVCQLNKVAIPPSGIEGSELMQVVIRALG